MPSATDAAPGFRFRIADLLLLLAWIAIVLSLCRSLKDLADTTEGTPAIGSQIKVIDGVRGPVPVRVYVLKDGTAVSGWYFTALYSGLAIQLFLLFIIAVWSYRRFRQR